MVPYEDIIQIKKEWNPLLIAKIDRVAEYYDENIANYLPLLTSCSIKSWQVVFGVNVTKCTDVD